LLALLLLPPAQAWAEWQIRPFVGLTFGGGTTFVDLERAAGKPNLVFGASGGWLGEVFGIDADFGYGPGFFQTGDQHLVLNSSATTLTGNVVIALPRRLAQYGLRPYFVGGAGLMHVRIDDSFGALPVARSLAAIDVGGGATGFVSDRIGVNWDVRYFRSIGRGTDSGLSFGAEQLSFWRANIALAIRY
jgi:hypothetical protein